MSKKKRTGYNPLDDFLPQIPDNRGKEKEAETISKTKPNAQSKTETKPKTKTKTVTKTKANSKTFAKTFAEGIKEKAGQGRTQQRFEDIRRRQTYWLTDDDIMRIDELSKETGVKKYDVVAAGVLLLHEYVFGKEDVSE